MLLLQRYFDQEAEFVLQPTVCAVNWLVSVLGVELEYRFGTDRNVSVVVVS